MVGQRYAVLFKTFAFDDFVKRRLAHVAAAAPSGDIFVLIDETQGPAGEIAFDRVIRYREADLVALGFPHIAQGSLFWYNADYPLYYFQSLGLGYDVVVAIEYDAAPGVDLDGIVDEFRRQDLDLVAHTIDKTADTYWWTATMLRFYQKSQIRPTQICAAIFSARAIDHLAACRKRQGAAGVAAVSEWPIGETFVGTELTAAGYRVRDLAAFGQLTRYDWWPPVHERELPHYAGEVFVHPVLAGRRYVKSLFKSNIRSGLIVSVKLLRAALARKARRRLQTKPRPQPGFDGFFARSDRQPRFATAKDYWFGRKS